MIHRQTLSPAFLRAIKPPAEGRDEYADDATPGLQLRVSHSGKRMWTLLVRTKEGKLRRETLGEYSDIHGLKWARDEVAKRRHTVRHEGRDPKKEREAAKRAAKEKAERDRVTLKMLVTEWRQQALAKKSERYAAEAERALSTVFAKHWERPAAALDADTIRRALQELRAKKQPTRSDGTPKGMVADRSAILSRTVAYGRACFNWAISYRMATTNPFLALPKDMRAPSEGRDRVLTDDELKAVWKAAEVASAPFGSLVRMLILTGQRREEVAGMRWGEVSDDMTTWTLPTARTKNGQPHIVPLSQAARALLGGRPEKVKPGTLVFPGQTGETPFGGWSKAKAKLDTDAGVTDWRIHDLRRTVATGLQRLGIKLEVTEAVLNHVSGSRAGIVGIYQRHDWAAEKRAALDTWAAHVAAIQAEKPTGRDNVVHIPRARA